MDDLGLAPILGNPHGALTPERKDAAESETGAADLFEESVERERHAALAVSKGPDQQNGGRKTSVVEWYGMYLVGGWWFGTCFIFPYIGNDME